MKSLPVLERSRGWVVKQALTAWIEQQEEHQRLTIEALADVDSGAFVDHTTVEDWARGLDNLMGAKS